MKVFILFITLSTMIYAQVMRINTPYRGALYDKVKPFMQELFKRNHLDVHYQRLPLKRALINANTGVDDGDGPRVRMIGEKFKNLIRLEVPILEISIHAHVKDKNLLAIKSWKDLKTYRVGVRTGTVIQVNNVKKINPKQIIYVSTNKQLFQLLEKDRVDVVVAEKFMSRGMKKKLGLEHLKATTSLLHKKMYLYLNKKHKDKVKAFEKTLLEMQKEGKQEALKRFYHGK